MEILYEKIIQDGTISNRELIKCSEARRTMLQCLEHNKGSYDACATYYQLFLDVLKQVNKCRIHTQPLFAWHGVTSTCWLYEKLNVLERLYEACELKSCTTDLKAKRKHHMLALKHSLDSLETLTFYQFEDASVKYLALLQDRYHLMKAFKHTGLYYATMNTFSVQTNGTENLPSIKNAYSAVRCAANVWKQDSTLDVELHKLKCVYLMAMAKNLEDDQCGEKVALLKDVVEFKETPESVKSYFKMINQQNERVYYQEEKTEKKIEPMDVAGVVGCFLNILGQTEPAQ